jgi:hypothetical protein
MYDFKMGGKLRDYIIQLGLTVVHEENKPDRELTFSGPPEPQILRAWENRFDRMYLFKEYMGEDNFRWMKNEFIHCLSADDHVSKTIMY